MPNLKAAKAEALRTQTAVALAQQEKLTRLASDAGEFCKQFERKNKV